MSTTTPATDLLLSPAELVALTGYKLPSAQLATLQAQGFHRARRNPAGQVVLERAHYEAVCRSESQAPRPRVKPPSLRPAVRTAAAGSARSA
jgi:hypothetical protein